MLQKKENYVIDFDLKSVRNIFSIIISLIDTVVSLKKRETAEA